MVRTWPFDQIRGPTMVSNLPTLHLMENQKCVPNSIKNEVLFPLAFNQIILKAKNWTIFSKNANIFNGPKCIFQNTVEIVQIMPHI